MKPESSSTQVLYTNNFRTCCLEMLQRVAQISRTPAVCVLCNAPYPSQTLPRIAQLKPAHNPTPKS